MKAENFTAVNHVFSHALFQSSGELVALAESLKLLLDNVDENDRNREGTIDFF